MKRKPFLVLISLIACVLIGAFAWAHTDPSLPQVCNDRVDQQTVFAAPAESGGTESLLLREEVPTNPDNDGLAGALPHVVPAFWFYVNRIRAITDEDATWREVRMPTTALKAMSKETLKCLAVESLDGIEFGSVIPGDGGGIQTKLSDTLVWRWRKIADTTKEDLVGAVMQYANETIGARVWESSPPHLYLSMNLLGYFTANDKAVERFAPELVSVLRSLPSGVKLDSSRVQPILMVLAKASWKENRGWLRQQVLELVALPWMSKAQVAAFIMQLTSGASWSLWASDIQNLIANGSPAAIWGAIEALRGFASTDEITAQALVDAIPAKLLSHSDSALRWALYELLATYGGPSGEVLLTGLLNDTTFPFRPDVLSYLAHEGKVSTETCLGLLRSSDKALRDAAINALGHLSKKDPGALASLLDLALGNSDSEIRMLAVRSLGISGRKETLAMLDQALADADSTVQLEALSQIGRFKEPQPERLLAAAKNLALPAECRSLAYRELILDASDEDASSVFSSMYNDPDADISSEGYVWQAALAVAKNDQDGLKAWQELPIPDRIMQEVSSNPAISSIVGSMYNVRSGIVDEVHNRIKIVTSPEYREAIAQKKTREFMMGLSGRSTGFGRHLAYEERILRFLGK